MQIGILLTKTTPLPWLEVMATDGDKRIGTDQGDHRITTLDGNTVPMDHTYLVHAANVLPELVAAAKHLQANWEKNLSEPIARLREALALAKEVRLEPEPAAAPVHPPVMTRQQEQAVRRFIECWNLSMPYHGIGSALNCGECNALHQLLMAFEAVPAADALMAAHAVGDDEGDDPEHLKFLAGA